MNYGIKVSLHALSLSVVLLFGLISCGEDKPAPAAPSVKPVPEKPEPEAENVLIGLNTAGIHSISLQTLEPYSYLLDISGDDPYVFSDRLPENLKPSHLILEFEYKSLKPIDELQIFYARNGAPSEAFSRKYGKLEASSSYRKFAVDISTFTDASFGTMSDCIRIDLGTGGNFSFHIRNILFREMNDEEKMAHEKARELARAKEQVAENIREYLSRSYPSRITEVTVTEDKVTVRGQCGGSGTFLLADVCPWHDITELETFPYTEEIKDRSFTIILDRKLSRENIIYDRVFSKWAVVKKDGGRHILDSHGHYADKVAPISSPEALALKNKKGFGAGLHSLYFDDCKKLDVGSTTMNVVLNSLVNSKGAGYQYGGVNFTLSSAVRNQMDQNLLKLAETDVVVSAIILTQSNSSYRDPECTGGYYTMPNMTTAEAFNLYAGALEYLASRYNGSGYGRISHWIMHNEVDMGIEWTNMGEQPMLRFLDRYVKSMRICYNIVRQYDQNASVLASYTHTWSDPASDYCTRKMLETTLEYSRAEGDFWWGVAHHPYPQDLTRPEFWKNDTQSTPSMNSQFVTFRNLEVIDSWIKQKENLYMGTKKRTLFLSEQGTNSPSYSAADLELQAAGAAWAWKKVSRLDGIDAMQWHNWADNRGEFSLRIGLRAFADAGLAELAPKPAWYVWKAAGTADEASVLDPYKSVLGISDWSEIFFTVR